MSSRTHYPKSADRLARRFGIAMPFAAFAALVFVTSAQAHVLKDFGPYTVALGWVHEPTYVGATQRGPGGGQGHQGEAGDRHRRRRSQGRRERQLVRTRARLTWWPTYDEDTGLGTPGDYEAPLIPTVPGDYTFHLTGKIHDTAVDETATSSDSTFDSAVDDTAIQFPAKVPTLTEVTTRLDRLDARVGAIASALHRPPRRREPTARHVGERARPTLRARPPHRPTTRRRPRCLVAVVLGGLGVVLGAVSCSSRRGVAGRQPAHSHPMRIARGSVATGLALVAVLLLAGSAAAHALPQSSDPSAGRESRDATDRRDHHLRRTTGPEALDDQGARHERQRRQQRSDHRRRLRSAASSRSRCRPSRPASTRSLGGRCRPSTVTSRRARSRSAWVSPPSSAPAGTNAGRGYHRRQQRAVRRARSSDAGCCSSDCSACLARADLRAGRGDAFPGRHPPPPPAWPGSWRRSAR